MIEKLATDENVRKIKKALAGGKDEFCEVMDELMSEKETERLKRGLSDGRMP